MSSSPLSLIVLPVDDTPVAAAAELLAAAGLAPIPLYGLNSDGTCQCGPKCEKRTRGKHPVGHGWQAKATLDLDGVRDRFRKHNGNIGVYLALGGLVLIDADGEGGVALAESWGLPPTLTQRSGSGVGRHYIYRLQPHQRSSGVTDRRVAGDDAGHIDVKIRGQFACAPSLHTSGQRYRFTSAVPVAPLPDEIYERIRKPDVPTPKPDAPTPPRRDDVSDLLKRARKEALEYDPGISGQGGHNATFVAAKSLACWMVTGLPESNCWELLLEYNMRCEPPWSEKELLHKWESAKNAREVRPKVDRPNPRALVAIRGGKAPITTSAATPGQPPSPSGRDWRAELDFRTSRKGDEYLAPTADNVVRILQLDPRWAGRIRFNSFSYEVSCSKDLPWDKYHKPSESLDYWTDSDATRLQSWMQREWKQYGFTPTISDCEHAVDVVAKSRAYHPVRDYLSSLRWDGTSRLRTWLSQYLGAEQGTYTELVGRWWLISAVARILRPGCMVRTVPILEGEQELKKSTAIATLAGADWTQDTPIDLGSKDAYLGIQGYWMVELAELDSLMRVEASRAKAFFSSSTDRYRPPYGRQLVRVPRQCLFVGTVNPPYTYLNDPSGNTRYHPIRCTKIDIPGLAAARDQLWAEAIEAYNEGALWYAETQGERALLSGEQDERAAGDAWSDKIEAYLSRTNSKEVATSELLGHALQLPAHQWTRANETRIGIIMTIKLRWVKRRVTSTHLGPRRWVYQSE
jgi:predicted P-loop ATPase